MNRQNLSDIFVKIITLISTKSNKYALTFGFAYAIKDTRKLLKKSKYVKWMVHHRERPYGGRQHEQLRGMDF